jgi:DNA-directed RNA polymerase sigma subunit (sigma70/sigma32)
MSVAEVAQVLGISRARVSQLEERALMKCRRAFQAIIRERMAEQSQVEKEQSHGT